MQAIRSTRPAGTSATSASPTTSPCPARSCSSPHVHLHGGPAPVRRFLPDLIERIWDRKIDPGKVFDLTLPLDDAADGYRAMDTAPGDQGPAAPVNPTYDFTGQVALVTGAGSGMGLATARAFAEAGAAVVLADVNATAVSAATDETVQRRPPGARAVTCDVADEDSVAAMVGQRGPHVRRLDMAFNNAGIQAPPTDAADEPAELFDRVNAVNLRGVWACMKHEAAAQMRGQRSGAIVNCSSLGGLVGLPAGPPTTPPSTASSG